MYHLKPRQRGGDGGDEVEERGRILAVSIITELTKIGLFLFYPGQSPSHLCVLLCVVTGYG